LLFNLAVDSKPQGCDVVAVRVDDIAPNAQLRHFDQGQQQYGHLTAFKQCSGRAARPFERQSMSALVKSRYFRKY
jgi:hypothetical protein